MQVCAVNASLKEAYGSLTHAASHRDLSADLFQLSGILAVRIAGGPFINFTPGETFKSACSIAPAAAKLSLFS